MTDALKTRAGITSLSPYSPIFAETSGRITCRLNGLFEQAQGKYYCRLQRVSFVGKGNSGSKTQAFAWPVEDPENPLELIQIANKIIAATAPGVTQLDPRSGLGKLFDRLFRLTFVNELPELDSYQTKHKHTLSATIYDEKTDVMVSFRHCVEGRGCTTMRLPLPAFEALKTWAGIERRIV